MENYSPKIWQPIDFTIYFAFIRWLVAWLLILEITFRFFINRLGAGWFFDEQEIIAWILRLALFVFLGFRVRKNFGRSAAVAAISGALSGFVVGLVIAFFRFFNGFKIWKFFNLITETTLNVIVGSLAAILVIYLFNFIRSTE